jgi:CRP/FNR family transcriptional regulator
MNLDNFYFYSLLSDNAKDLVKKNMKPFKMQKNGILYYAGDVCDDFVLIDSGGIRVYVQGEGQETFTLYTVSDGQPCIINTFSTIFSSVTIANAEVEEEIQGWMLNKKILLQLLATEPEYSAYLFSMISDNIASLVNTIKDIKFMSISEQLEEWLFSKNSTLIQTTHEQIAMHLGTSRPVISKLLKDLENENKIELKRGAIQVL